MDESHLRSILNGFTGGELEFLCEDELVEIVPSFRQDALPLLGSDQPVGPFIPAATCAVPLWLAIALKKQRRATLEPPAWFHLEMLTQWRDRERAADAFERPPAHCYIELARVLLHYARDDMERVTGTPSKDLEERLGDIQDIRQAKIKKGLDLIKTDSQYIHLNNLSSMELNTIRTFYCAALSRFQRLHKASDDSATASSQSQSQDAEMRAPQQATESQRRDMRRNATFGAPSQSSPAAAAASPSQPGALTQAAEQNLEQARKLRRFGP